MCRQWQSEYICACCIGYRLSYSRGLLRSDAVILCMLVIGLVGILMDKLLTALFRRLLPWQKKA